MKKQEIVNFIYYLEDKIDEVYKKEVSKEIEKFIKELMEKGEVFKQN